MNGHAPQEHALAATAAPRGLVSEAVPACVNPDAASHAQAAGIAVEADLEAHKWDPQMAYLKFEPCSQFSLQHMSSHRFEIVQDFNQPGLFYDSDVARARFLIPNFRPSEGTSHVSLGELQKKVLDQLAANQATQLDAWEPAALLTQCAWQLQKRFDNWNNQVVGDQHTPASAANIISTGCAVAGSDSRAASPLAEISSIPKQSTPPRLPVLLIEVGGTAGELEHIQCCEVLTKAFGEPALHIHLTRVLSETNKTKPAQTSLRSLVPRPHVVFVRLCQSGSSGSAADTDVDFIDSICSTLQHNSCLPLGTLLLPVKDDLHWPERAYFDALGSSSELLELIQQRMTAAAAQVTKQPLHGHHSVTAGPSLGVSFDALQHAVSDDGVFTRAGSTHNRCAHSSDRTTSGLLHESQQQSADYMAIGTNSCNRSQRDTDCMVLSAAQQPKRCILILHDGDGEVGYSSLAVRIRTWSKGQLIPVFLDVTQSYSACSDHQGACPTARSSLLFQSVINNRMLSDNSRFLATEPGNTTGGIVGAVLIGKSAPLQSAAEGLLKTYGPLEQLVIVPALVGKDTRDPDARPDWMGTSDKPSGALAEFVMRCLLKAGST